MKSAIIATIGAAVLATGGTSFAADPATMAPTANTAATAAETTVAKSAIGYATTQSASEWRSTKIVGLNVYNAKNEKIGDINDLIISDSGEITHAVIGVGGFLGMGEKNVAVPFGTLKMNRDNNGKPSATVDSTREALTAAPAFKFYANS